MARSFIPFAAAVAVAAAAFADADPSAEQKGNSAAERLYGEKYASIVQRLPFGQEPSGFDPDTLVTSASSKGAAAGVEEVPLAEEQAALVNGVKVGIINVSLDGSAYVGFTDSTVNPARNYYIRLGESQGDWSVIGVDGDRREATLKKKDVEVTLKLGGGAGGKMGEAAGASPEAAGAVRAMSAAATGGVRPPDGVSSARQKLAARRAQKEADDAEAKAAREAAEERAREAMERAEADRAAMREQLSALSESLRLEREERERRDREEAEMREREGASSEEAMEE